MAFSVTSLRHNVSALNSNLNRALVGAYKVAGFAVLVLILLGIASYVGTHGFYLVHRAWLKPTIVSPTDPRVLDLRARIAHEDSMRRRLLGERSALEVRLRKAQRLAELERVFESDFRRAMQKEAAQRKKSLAELDRLRKRHEQLDSELRATARRLIAPAQKKIERDYKNRLIDEEQMLRERFLLLQIAEAELTAQRARVDLGERARRLQLEAEAFEGASNDFGEAEEPITYHELTLHREREVSWHEALGARDEAEALQRGLEELDEAIVRYDELLGTLEQSPLLRAIDDKITLGFVPYDNQTRVAEGAPVYACRLGVLFCRRVGRIEAFWEGEVEQRHPVYGREVRGQLAELVLEDEKFAKAAVLHVNRAPLLL